MLETKWLYELILFIYGLSLIGYFIDFIQQNRKANRVAFWLLSMVWVLQTIFLCLQIFIENSFPVATLTDSLFFYSWILVIFSLIINKIFKVYFIVFFTNLFSFFILLLHILTSANQGIHVNNGSQLVHEIIITHVMITILSYGFFTFSFIFSVMYLIQYYFLKEKKGLKWIWRFGDLQRLDQLSFTSITIGVPLLLIGIILGFVWAFTSNEEFYWFDLKTIGSILVLLVYIGYLILRLITGYRGKSIAIYNSGAFLFLLINFFLFNMLSNFHF
ncbi:cytochrome C assembly family protein [Ornithinibacillus halophilus]|uniref:HemX family protein n=1 Tax=Ornithinibacillus halophilus TaxID=930117 RepID=A0A1M5DD14_9BACI|nr:cytochrome c biogenesis protein CcsA [Ornithinibacillus halophilus]SHF64805.1 HemX family protein [Ornithinibacillus halophilus]